MKKILFLLACMISLAQAQDYATLLDSGKAVFKQDFADQDYQKAVEYLEQAAHLEPDSAEAHYFLGYAYSRLNAKHGENMVKVSRPLIEKSSAAFERVIRLTPEYQGEMVVLDPYSKLTSEWGSLAMAYLYRGEQDSALWAFEEGKRRGGFGNFFLAVSRASLDECEPEAILLTSGDNFTFPMWYLQTVEKYRTDVAIVDVTLLNALWYPEYLSREKTVKFGLKEAELDSLQYQKWQDSVIRIKSFEWRVKSGQYPGYLLRGERLLLNLLEKNRFRRPVYFTAGFIEAHRLGLGDYLLNLTLADRIQDKEDQKVQAPAYLASAGKALSVVDHLNTNSSDERTFLDAIRYRIMQKMGDLMQDGDIRTAEALLKRIESWAPPSRFPFQQEQGQEALEYFRQRLAD